MDFLGVSGSWALCGEFIIKSTTLEAADLKTIKSSFFKLRRSKRLHLCSAWAISRINVMVSRDDLWADFFFLLF